MMEQGSSRVANSGSKQEHRRNQTRRGISNEDRTETKTRAAGFGTMETPKNNDRDDQKLQQDRH